jgi:hypothetical protein
MDQLAHADGGEIAVALVGEHNLLGPGALDARSDGRRASMRNLHRIGVEVLIRKNRAPHAGDGHRLLNDAEFLKDLTNQTVRDAMGAARAVAHARFSEALGILVYDFGVIV